MRRTPNGLACLGLIVAIALTACAPAPTLALTPVTVQLVWTHQAQFAGLYAADQNGTYAAEGLTPTFLEGGAGVDKLAPVLNGTAQFGLAAADELILARSQGLPVRALASIYRRSPIGFVSLAEKGLTRPQDFAGQTIRAAANVQPSLRAMLARVGVSPDQYTIVDLPADIDMFASGEVPVWGMFMNVFGVTIKQAGYAINVVYPDDYGVHFYADTLFTTDALIASDPALVQRFVRATLQGWTYAVEHPAEVAALVQHYQPTADLTLENARMVANLPLVDTGEDHIGWMQPATWAAMADTLRVQGVLTAPLTITDVYTLDFLEAVYP